VWSIIVPVKSLGRAKTRLAPSLDSLRPQLALAFACDAVSAIADCEEVARILVVTADQLAARTLADLGAVIVSDRADIGLNQAVAAGARVAPRSERPAVVTADLPCLRSADLAMVLKTADALRGRSFVADSAGTGTTLLAASAGRDLLPLFGPGSRSAHLLSGARQLLDAAPGVRRDVDTAADLHKAISLGIGPFTQKVLQDHGIESRSGSDPVGTGGSQAAPGVPRRKSVAQRLT
jgi:2-phospho-L-lactate guanylyltransferase